MHPKHGKDKTHGWQAGRHTRPRGAPSSGTNLTHTPAEPGSARHRTKASEPPARRPARGQHLHGLRRLPDQAGCLCLLQGLRASHPQRALGSGLGDGKAGFLRRAPGEQPRQAGAGEAAVLQCRWRQLLASGAARARTLRQLLFSELLPAWAVGRCLVLGLGFFGGFCFSVQMSGVYTPEQPPGRCDRVIIC